MKTSNNNSKGQANTKVVNSQFDISEKRQGEICKMVSDIHDRLAKEHTQLSRKLFTNAIFKDLNTPSEALFAGLIIGGHCEALGIMGDAI